MKYTLKQYNKKINNSLKYGKVEILECSTTHKECRIKCLECGEVLNFSKLGNVVNRAKTQGWVCKKCGQLVIRKKDYEQKLINKFPNEPVEILEFNGFTKECKIKCKKCGCIKKIKQAKKIYDYKHLCSKCFPPRYKDNKKLKRDFLNFIKKSDKWILIDSLDGKKSNDLIACKCKICGDINKKSFRTYLKGFGCAKCSGTKKKTTEEFKRELDDDYELLSEYINTHTKVLLRHTDCGFIFKMTPDAYLHQFQRCPRCKRQESMGEKIIREFLEKYHIEYIKEYPVDIEKRHLRFDFYLPKEDVYIEFNGQQHYKITKFSPTEEALKNAQYRDNLKKEYCGDKLLIITYKQMKNISDILQSQKWFNDYRNASSLFIE